MKYLKNSCRIKKTLIVFTMIVGLIYVNILPAHSHGGKTHDEATFTAFQAAQKAIKLFDRLITSGKLSKEWETGLKSIKISTGNSSDKHEYVVQFERDKGDPSSVYFFFNQDGEYSGSNFTGS